MSADIWRELEFLRQSVWIGVMISFLYDGVRIVRRIVPHNQFFVSVEDVIFWCYCSVCMFQMLYRENNGTLRWFVILGAVSGMLLYKVTVGRLYVKYVTLVSQKVIHVSGRCLYRMTRPVRILLRYGKKKLTQTWKMLKIVLHI